MDDPESRTTATDSSERKLLDDVRQSGWHFIYVLGEGRHEPFSYTVGLFHTFGHPELLIYGLPKHLAHAILTIAAEAAASGKPLDLERPTDELLEGYPCVFVPVPLHEYPGHVGFARWYYRGDDFPVIQVVWPSNTGLFPWHPEAPPAFRSKQPVLGQHAQDA